MHRATKMCGIVSKQCLITYICIYILHRDISSTVNVTHSKAFVIISVTSMLCRPQTTGWNYPNVSARITHALLRDLVCILPQIICMLPIVAPFFFPQLYLSLSDLLSAHVILIRIEKKKSRVLFSSLELNYPQVQGKIEGKIIEFSRD